MQLFKPRRSLAKRKTSSEVRSIKLSGEEVNYTLVRSSRKSLGFEIKQGQLWVRAPERASFRWIEQVLNERAQWIKDHLVRQSDHIQSHQPDPFHKREVSWLGITYPVVLREASRSDVLFDGECFYLYLGLRGQKTEQERVNALLIKWFKSQAHTHLIQRVQYWANIMNESPSKVEVKSFKRMWGRCSSKGEIALNWRLMLASPEAIDYVVIHELAHLKEFNHSPAFWRRVAVFCPQYTGFRRYFNERGSWLNW
jgi:predicted metal-dependent hydrolase